MKNNLKIWGMFFIILLSVEFFVGCGYMGKDKKQYDKAEKLFSEQKYVLSFKEYKSFLNRFPKSKFYDKAINGFSECEVQIVKQGDKLLFEGQISEAYELHKMFLNELSGNSRINESKECAKFYFILANALFDKKSFSDAIKVYQIGLELDPSNMEAQKKLKIAKDKEILVKKTADEIKLLGDEISCSVIRNERDPFGDEVVDTFKSCISNMRAYINRNSGTLSILFDYNYDNSPAKPDSLEYFLIYMFDKNGQYLADFITEEQYAITDYDFEREWREGIREAKRVSRFIGKPTIPKFIRLKHKNILQYSVNTRDASFIAAVELSFSNIPVH